jgi:hypothetical protein
MPVIIRCGKCGSILEEFNGLPDEFWYPRLRDKLQDKCPKCGKDLPKPRDLSTVIKINIQKNPSWPPLSFSKSKTMSMDEIIQLARSENDAS